MDKYLVIANFVETQSEYRESRETEAGKEATFVAWDSNLMTEHWKMCGLSKTFIYYYIKQQNLDITSITTIMLTNDKYK